MEFTWQKRLYIVILLILDGGEDVYFSTTRIRDLGLGSGAVLWHSLRKGALLCQHLEGGSRPVGEILPIPHLLPKQGLCRLQFVLPYTSVYISQQPGR